MTWLSHNRVAPHEPVGSDDKIWCDGEQDRHARASRVDPDPTLEKLEERGK